jgi:hypothetical protein
MQVARCFQLGLLLCIAAHRAEAQTTIRTYETPTPHALGAAFNNPFNGGSDQSQGQTFTVPHDDTNLVSFSFWALGFDVAGQFQGEMLFRAFIAPWNGFGSPIVPVYSSPILTGPSDGILHQVTFFTGGIQLQPDAVFLAFISPADAGNVGGMRVLFLNDSDFPGPYSGGKLVSSSMPTGASLSVLTFNVEQPDLDLLFEASFDSASAVPEPSTSFLVGTGLIGLTMVSLLRRGRKGLS